MPGRPVRQSKVVQPLRARAAPYFFTFVAFSGVFPAPANPVIPLQVVRSQERPAAVASSKFFPVVPFSGAFPAEPVIPIQVVKFDERLQAVTTSKYFPVVPFSGVFPAEPIIPVRVIKFAEGPQAVAPPKFFLLVPPSEVVTANPTIEFVRLPTTTPALPAAAHSRFFTLVPFSGVFPAEPVIEFRKPAIAVERPQKFTHPQFIEIILPPPDVTYQNYEAILQVDVPQYILAATFIFEAVLQTGNASNTARCRLFNVTDNVAVSGGEVTTTSTTPVRLRTSAVTLTGTKEYRAQAGFEAGATTTVFAARLIVQQ